MFIGFLDVLDTDQSNKVVKLVEELEGNWVRREIEPIDFFTI